MNKFFLGSGNALSSSLGFFGDPLSAALAVIKGETMPLDLCRVVQPFSGLIDTFPKDIFLKIFFWFEGKPDVWAFAAVCWGIVADVDIESEKWRFMGELRFALGGVQGIMSHKRNHAVIYYLPQDEDLVSNKSSDNQQQQQAESVTINSLLDQIDMTTPPSNWKVIDDDFYYFVAGNIPFLSVDLKIAPNARFNDGHIDLIMAREGRKSLSKLEVS